VHDSAHFRELLPNPDARAPMDRSGALADRLRAWRRDPSRAARGAAENQAAVRRCFDWDSLVPAYLAMYRTVAERHGLPRG
jgi:hypothetical protein